MKQQSIMQSVLKDEWEVLPQVLKDHYQINSNYDEGYLTIEYPKFMQPVLNILSVMGVLINKKGENLDTTVSKQMMHKMQIWKRKINFENGQTVQFDSQWQYHNNNQLIEFVNPFLGLKMKAYIIKDRLHYEGICYLLKLGGIMIPIPEWLLLGHTTIEEQAIDKQSFKMDFKLTHPLFGELYRYKGVFTTKLDMKG